MSRISSGHLFSAQAKKDGPHPVACNSTGIILESQICPLLVIVIFHGIGHDVHCDCQHLKIRQARKNRHVKCYSCFESCKWCFVTEISVWKKRQKSRPRNKGHLVHGSDSRVAEGRVGPRHEVLERCVADLIHGNERPHHLAAPGCVCLVFPFPE